MAEIIERLQLEPLEREGGWFRRTVESNVMLPAVAIPNHGGDRHTMTSILFLVEGLNQSWLHRLVSHEMLFFHVGSPLVVHCIHAESDGSYERIVLGTNFEKGETPQCCMQPGAWFGTSLEDENGWSLISCCVAPGFEFDDFEIANADALVRDFPQHTELIRQLERTRSSNLKL